jgi:hypothetical protein
MNVLLIWNEMPEVASYFKIEKPTEEELRVLKRVNQEYIKIKDPTKEELSLLNVNQKYIINTDDLPLDLYLVQAATRSCDEIKDYQEWWEEDETVSKTKFKKLTEWFSKWNKNKIDVSKGLPKGSFDLVITTGTVV